MTMSDKRFVVELNVGVYGCVNMQGCSAWHNGDPGEDDISYKIIPILQLIYNQTTDTWHRPGKIMKSSLVKDGNFHMMNHDAHFVDIGTKALSKKQVHTILTRKVRSMNFKNIMKSLRDHNKEGQRIAFEKYHSEEYIDEDSWSNYEELTIRVREIVEDASNNKKDIWEYRDPTQRLYSQLMDNFNPYPFHTKHIYYSLVDKKNIVRLWKSIQKCFETNRKEL